MPEMKKYSDYLEHYKVNIIQWVNWYGMNFKEAYEGIKKYINLAPLDYRSKLKEELKIWSLENEKVV